MATPFIIKKGLSNSLPTTLTDGTIYFCTDTGEMYVGVAQSNGSVEKVQITNLTLLNKITELDEELSNFITTTTSNFENQQTKIDNITPITAQNKTPSWTLQSTPTYTDFPYRGSISISGVTADMIPEVTFSPTEALSGNYAPIAQTYAGGVYIYSKVSTSITVPTIICHPKGTSV